MATRAAAMPPKSRPLAPVLARGLPEVEAAGVASVLAGTFTLPLVAGAVGLAVAPPLSVMPLSPFSTRSREPFLATTVLLELPPSP